MLVTADYLQWLMSKKTEVSFFFPDSPELSAEKCTCVHGRTPLVTIVEGIQDGKLVFSKEPRRPVPGDCVLFEDIRQAFGMAGKDDTKFVRAWRTEHSALFNALTAKELYKNSMLDDDAQLMILLGTKWLSDRS